MSDHSSGIQATPHLPPTTKETTRRRKICKKKNNGGNNKNMWNTEITPQWKKTMANKWTPISLRVRNLPIAWWCGDFFNFFSFFNSFRSSVCLWQQFTLFVYAPAQWTTWRSRDHTFDMMKPQNWFLHWFSRIGAFFSLSRFSSPMSLLGVYIWSMKCTTVDGAHVLLLSNTKATLLFHLCVSLIRKYYTRWGARSRSLVQSSGI